MNWFALALGSLVTFRLSLLLTKEDGPAYLFRKLRKLPPPKSSARDGLQCIWCASVTFSAVVTWYLWRIEMIPGNLTPLFWLAQSSCAIFMNQQWTRG